MISSSLTPAPEVHSSPVPSQPSPQPPQLQPDSVALSHADVLTPPNPTPHARHASNLGRPRLEPPVRRPRSCISEMGLSQKLGQAQVCRTLMDFSQLARLDESGSRFWATFESCNSRLCRCLLPAQQPGDLILFNETDVRRILDQQLKPEVLSQFLYWLLVSPHGPDITVILLPAAKLMLLRKMADRGIANAPDHLLASHHEKARRKLTANLACLLAAPTPLQAKLEDDMLVKDIMPRPKRPKMIHH